MNTQGLLTSIKSRAFIPTSQITFTDAEILQLADEVILEDLLPALMLAKPSEWYVTYSDFTLDGESSTAYRVPQRSLKLRDIQIVDGDNHEDVKRLRLEDLPFGKTGYLIRNGNLHFFGYASGDVARVWYYMQPSRLVTLAEVGVVTVINNNIVTVSAVPAAFTGSSVCDFVRATGSYEALGINYSASNILGNDITFTANAPNGLAVGDHVSLAGESAVVMLPLTLHPALAQGVAVKILTSIGDMEAAMAAESKYKEIKAAVFSLVAEPADDASVDNLIRDDRLWR